MSRESKGPFSELAELVLTGDQPEWLRALRERAWVRFEAQGIPTTHDEEWRFTPLRGLPTPRLSTLDSRLSFTSGELPTGVQLLSLADAIARGVPEVEQHLARFATPEITPFAALNAALFTDGVVLIIPAGVVIEEPVRIGHAAGSDGAIHAPRVLVIAGRNSRATVVETFGDGTGNSYFTNACCEIVMAEGSRIDHLRLQHESTAAWHIGLTQVDQQRDSRYRSVTLDLGGRLSRHNLHARLNAPNIETLLYGLYTPGDQLVDNHTAIYHDQPNCNSWEVYKGILGDRARAVFNGKVLVQPEAQKTDAKQTNRNLLFTDQARVDTKPQLEIFADDVRCTHGATIGKPDPLQRYYLQTRGIGGRTAQSLLLWAFAAEVLTEISLPSLREEIERTVRARLDLMVG